MNINQSAVQILIKELQQLKKQGLNAKKAIPKLHHQLGVVASQVITARSVSEPIHYEAKELSTASKAVYTEELTPLSLAEIMKSIYGDPADVVEGVYAAFPDMTATEMGELLLEPSLYPDLTEAEMQEALVDGGYTETEATTATNTLYIQPVDVSFKKPKIDAVNCTVKTGQGTMFNSYYKKSWIMHYPARSFIQFDYNQPKTDASPISLVLVHLTSSMGNKQGFSPIDIVINDQVFKSRYNVGRWGYTEEVFDVTNFIKDGDNTIRLNFCSGARTNYWIQSFKMVYSK